VGRASTGRAGGLQAAGALSTPNSAIELPADALCETVP
jgi:hypothetical protein